MKITTAAEFTADEVIDRDKVKEILTVKNPDYATWQRWGSFFGEAPDEFILCYTEKRNGNLVVPRNFQQSFPELFNPQIKTISVYRSNIHAGFTGTLRKYQDDFSRFIPDDVCDQLWEMPCGTGKTVMGAWWTCRRKQRTLVLVPQTIHGEQWLATYRDVTDIKNVQFPASTNFHKVLEDLPDVLIMTFDLFYSRDLRENLPDNFYQNFGLVIMDEAHVVGAPTYQPVLEKVPSKYRLALTATFRRNDGMHNILKFHFGRHITMQNPFEKVFVMPFKTGYSPGYLIPLDKILGGKLNREKNTKLLLDFFDKTGGDYRVKNRVLELFNFEDFDESIIPKLVKGYDAVQRITLIKIIEHFFRYNRDSGLSTVETHAADHISRTRKLNKVITNAIAKGRKVLVLSKRKNYLQREHRRYNNLGYKSCLFTSDTSSTETLKFAREEAHVIFCIYQIGKQGLDIPNIDTLVLVHPIRDLEQPAGRIAREFPGKQLPVIFYPIDNYGAFRGMFFGVQKVTRNVKVLQVKKLREVLDSI